MGEICFSTSTNVAHAHSDYYGIGKETMECCQSCLATPMETALGNGDRQT